MCDTGSDHCVCQLPEPMDEQLAAWLAEFEGEWRPATAVEFSQTLPDELEWQRLLALAELVRIDLQRSGRSGGELRLETCL